MNESLVRSTDTHNLYIIVIIIITDEGESRGQK